MAQVGGYLILELMGDYLYKALTQELQTIALLTLGKVYLSTNGFML